jgi:hypothetical protein
MPPEAIAALETANAETAKGFGVWRVNMPVVDAFLEVASQWRTAALADGRVLWLGLDYTAVRAGLEGAGIALTSTQWRGLGVIERAAASVLNGRS